jgi:hypothetical protein
VFWPEWYIPCCCRDWCQVKSLDSCHSVLTSVFWHSQNFASYSSCCLSYWVMFFHQVSVKRSKDLWSIVFTETSLAFKDYPHMLVCVCGIWQQVKESTVCYYCVTPPPFFYFAIVLVRNVILQLLCTYCVPYLTSCTVRWWPPGFQIVNLEKILFHIWLNTLSWHCRASAWK